MGRWCGRVFRVCSPRAAFSTLKSVVLPIASSRHLTLCLDVYSRYRYYLAVDGSGVGYGGLLVTLVGLQGSLLPPLPPPLSIVFPCRYGGECCFVAIGDIVLSSECGGDGRGQPIGRPWLLLHHHQMGNSWGRVDYYVDQVDTQCVQ